MKELKLNKRNEETGHNARRLRRNGVIPGIVYGKKLGSLMFEIGQMDLLRDLSDAGEHGVVNFNLDGYSGTAVIKEVQKDAVNHNVIHVDLEEIDNNHTIESEVPIIFKGKDFLNEKGVVLQTQKDTVKVSCMPEDLPKSIEFDIKNAQIGSVFKLSDIEVGSEISIVDDLNTVLSSISGKQFMIEPEDDVEKK